MKLQREDIHPLQDTCPYLECCEVNGLKIYGSQPEVQNRLQKQIM